MTANYADINNYEFNKTIGEGNFAKVKLCTFKPTKEEFAIKIINKIKLKQKMKHTLFQEIEIISKLKHQNIITVYQIIEDPENYYIVMENCKKGELFDYIVENQNLSEKESSIFFYQLINGVEYIHSQNIVHRDLKPENLLLTENKILKIIDFGLSHYFDGDKLLKTKCGSPSYTAPEIINGAEYDGFKTDIWCCGVILYAMLCGFLPFGGENDNELFQSIIDCDPDIPVVLSNDSKKLLKRIFTPNPNKRITIQEIKQTKFYLKGRKYYNKIYDNNEDNNLEDTPTDKELYYDKDFCSNIMEEENENESNKNESKKNESIKNENIIEDGEKNNNDAITFVSNDEATDDNNIINNIKKGNNINIFNINKKNGNQANINKKNNDKKDIIDNKEIINDENKELEDKKNLIHLNLQGFDFLEKSLFAKKKLKINFNNNLKNNYNNNNALFNSFRKKLIKENLNQKFKDKFENYQKIIKTEANECKNDIIKMQSINQKKDNKINLITNSNIVNNRNNNISINSTIDNNNNSNRSIKQTNNILKIPNIKENELNYRGIKKKLILRLTNSNKEKNLLNYSNTNKSKKISFSKSPNKFQYILTNNKNNENSNNIYNQSSSLKRFINDLRKVSVKSLTNRKINNSNERKHLNSINAKTIDHINNSKSIETNNINNIYHKLIIDKKNFNSNWKKYRKNLIKQGKIMKNALNKNKIITKTPKRANLFYNNFSININTINVNENRIHKLKVNDYSEKSSKNKNSLNNTNNTNSDKKNSFNYINKKKLTINFSKLIEKARNSHNIYRFDTFSQHNGKIGKSLGHNHNIKDDKLFTIKAGNIKKYFDKRNISNNTFRMKNNNKSEEKRKSKEKNISLVNKDICINNSHKVKK